MFAIQAGDGENGEGACQGSGGEPDAAGGGRIYIGPGESGDNGSGFEGGDGGASETSNDAGVVDEEQSNVHTALTNQTTKTWVSFVHPEGCEFGSGSVGTEDGFEAKDATYNYPANFYGFQIACPQPTVTVQMYFHGLNGTAKDYIPRKYLSYNDTYITLQGASVQDVTIGGKNVIKVTYSIADGGTYDNDQVVNGVIIDPASLGYAPAAANGDLAAPGTNLFLQIVTPFVLLLGGAVIFIAVKRKKRSII